MTTDDKRPASSPSSAHEWFSPAVMATASVSPETFTGVFDLENRVVDAVLATLGLDATRIVPRLEDHPAALAYLEEALAIATTIEERLAVLPKDEFESILRGIFTEDEKVLVGIGGVIGGLIGTLQAVIALALG